MISRITGLLIEKNPPTLVVEVAGIAYEIEAPMSTVYDLPDLGQTVSLYTQLIVREDAHLLFGFLKSDERACFRTLLKVNGIGAKSALAILSALSLSELYSVVSSEDVSSLTKVPGIGKKTAERLILELRDKLVASVNIKDAHVSGAVDDAVSALVSLGYSDRDARSAINQADKDLPLQELIRFALQMMSSPSGRTKK